MRIKVKSAPLQTKGCGTLASFITPPLPPAVVSSHALCTSPQKACATRPLEIPLTNQAAGEIIGWGTGQGAAGVQATEQLAQNLTKEAVKEMVKKGLNKATVEGLKNQYARAAAEGVKEFRKYFLCVNGMIQVGGHDCDPTGFSFWPLARVKSVGEEYSKHSTALPEVPNPNGYFVFADYLQWCWAYAIHLGNLPSGPNPVIHVGTIRPKVVAGSFAEFVDLYLRDSKQLYPDAETIRTAP